MKCLRLRLVLVCLGLAVWSLSGVAFAQIAYERRTVLDWSSDGQFIALGSAEGAVKVFDAQFKRFIHEVEAHLGRVSRISWSPIDNRLLMSGGYDNTAKIWRIDADASPLILLESTPFIALDWKLDAQEIATAVSEGSTNLIIWNAITGERLRAGYIGTNLVIRWNISGTQIATGHLSGTAVYIFDIDSMKLLYALDVNVITKTWLISLDWSQDDAYLLGSDGYGRVFVWEVDNQKLVHTFDSAAVEDIAVGDPFTHAALKARFSADGRSVQAVNADGTIRSWDLATGQLRSAIKVARPIVSAAWSPYGAQLVVDLLNPPQSDAQDALSANNLRILVPFASLEQFNAIASVCITNAAEREALQAKATSESLAGLSAYISGLPTDVIPPACAADLLAIAAALQGK
jgi:WD40 repeat protein